MFADYNVRETLGRGEFAKVKLAYHVFTGQPVAIKIVNKASIKTTRSKKNLRREVDILRKLRHPHIIQLYEVLEDDKILALVMKYAKGGEALDYIAKKGHLEEKECRKLSRQLVSAIDHMHQNGIIHRDLKPENLLLDELGNIVITDFGLNNYFGMPTKNGGTGALLATRCGSPAYAAPEILLGEPYGFAVDIWSFGVTLYAMLTGVLPFPSDDFSVLIELIRKNKIKISTPCSPSCKDFVARCLCPNPKERISIDKAMHHPWLNQGSPKLQQSQKLKRRDWRDLDASVLRYLEETRHMQRAIVARSVISNACNRFSANYWLQRRKTEYSKTEKEKKGGVGEKEDAEEK